MSPFIRLMTLIVAAILIVCVLYTAAAEACNPRPSAAKIASLDSQYPLFKRELVRQFGRAWKEAAVVSYREGSWHKDARNGQYLGTFQMGEWARSMYGHGRSLVAQVIAAARYWRDSGWSGWECKP